MNSAVNYLRPLSGMNPFENLIGITSHAVKVKASPASSRLGSKKTAKFLGYVVRVRALKNLTD